MTDEQRQECERKEAHQQAKFLYRQYLEHLPNDGRYETWVTVGLLMHVATNGHLEGAKAFYQWSARSDRHTDEGFVTFWRDNWSCSAVTLLSAIARGTPALYQLDPVRTPAWALAETTIH